MNTNFLQLRDDLQTKNLTFKSIQNLQHIIVKMVTFLEINVSSRNLS